MIDLAPVETNERIERIEERIDEIDLSIAGKEEQIDDLYADINRLNRERERLEIERDELTDPVLAEDDGTDERPAALASPFAFIDYPHFTGCRCGHCPSQDKYGGQWWFLQDRPRDDAERGRVVGQ